MSGWKTKSAGAPNPGPRPAAAPFLVWPVARREFYALIAFALLLPLAWGIIIFGWRALVAVVAALLGATLAHVVLRRWTRRGRRLILAHTLASALVLGALAQRSGRRRSCWPPAQADGGFDLALRRTGKGAAFCRDHRGDARDAGGVGPGAARRAGGHRGDPRARSFVHGGPGESHPKRVHYFPRSAELDGQDAVELPYPQVVVGHLLRDLRGLIRQAATQPVSLPAAQPPALGTASATAPASAPQPAPRPCAIARKRS